MFLDVSIVIPCKKEEKRVPRLIESIIKEAKFYNSEKDENLGNVDLVVIDGASERDKTIEAATKTIVQNKNKLKDIPWLKFQTVRLAKPIDVNTAKKLALEFIGSKYVLFAMADDEAIQGFFKTLTEYLSMLEALRETNVYMGIKRIKGEDTFLERSFGEFYGLDAKSRERKDKVDPSWGLMPREVAMKVFVRPAGIDDHQINIHTARSLGLKKLMGEKALFVHHRSSNFNVIVRAQWWYGKSAIVHLLHPVTANSRNQYLIGFMLYILWLVLFSTYFLTQKNMYLISSFLVLGVFFTKYVFTTLKAITLMHAQSSLNLTEAVNKIFKSIIVAIILTAMRPVHYTGLIWGLVLYYILKKPLEEVATKPAV